MSSSLARRELERVVAALGHAVGGGAVYDAAVLWPPAPGPAPRGPVHLLVRIEAWPLPDGARAALGAAGRAWLRSALRRRHPDSPWLERL